MVTRACMRSPQVTGIGELLWDELPSGSRLGGATANFAVFSARLGSRVSLISSLGNDEYGREARKILAQPCLELTSLQTQAEYPTGTVKVRFSEGNQPVYTISRDVAWDFIEWTAELSGLAAVSDAIYFGTLSQRGEVSRATIRRFLNATPPESVRICDVNLRPPLCSSEVLNWSMAQATILKISDEELLSVFRLLHEARPEMPSDPGSPQVAAVRLLECLPKCKLVALTLGAHGCLVTTRAEASTHPGFPIQPIDPVGAGDAFTAGLVHAYLHGGSLAAMAEIGNLCGSYVASQPGATPELPASLIRKISLLLGSEESQVHDSAMN